MIKLVDIGCICDDPRRQIKVTNGEHTVCTTAVLVRESDYIRAWEFYAWGKWHTMCSELRCGTNGTELVWYVK